MKKKLKEIKKNTNQHCKLIVGLNLLPEENHKKKK